VIYAERLQKLANVSSEAKSSERTGERKVERERVSYADVGINNGIGREEEKKYETLSRLFVPFQSLFN
jgi:hypothetical protein